MKISLLPALLLTASFALAESNAPGIWKVRYENSQPASGGPKTIGDMILNLKVEGKTVGGNVVIGMWPGPAPISDGKTEGDHITFTATGHLDSSTGIPTCKFDVTIEGDKMHVALRAIKNAGGPMAPGYTFNYTCTRRTINQLTKREEYSLSLSEPPAAR
jgi:hypothetical protein